MKIDVHKYYDIVVQNWFKDVSYKAVRKIYFEFPIDEPREIFPPSINNFDSEKKEDKTRQVLAAQKKLQITFPKTVAYPYLQK